MTTLPRQGKVKKIKNEANMFNPEIIKEYRLKKQWDHETMRLELYKQFGQTYVVNTLKNWESGVTDPGCNDIDRIASLFGVKVQVFFNKNFTLPREGALCSTKL